MEISEYIKILAQGVKAWNKWRDENEEIKPDLIEAKLIGADLREANLFEAKLNKADLSRADLSFADLYEADLSKADLIEAKLIGALLSEANLFEANLNRADLDGADLSFAKLRGANLSEANLSGVDLSEAFLYDVDLSKAKLNRASLGGADLSRAKLRGADLSEANLNQVNLIEADLNGADFSNAKIGYNVFADFDLRNVVGLESTRHEAPSTIGIDTIFRSGGKIPHRFLEDAGVPRIFIEYMGSLTGQAFQFYSCFISHSTNDKDFTDRIYSDLRKEGVRCWFAPEDIKGGKKIHQQLDEAIRFYDKLLLILSEKSISSDWVANEIRWARKREKQDGKQKLFPVSLIDYEKLKDWELFDADTATDLAAEVRSYFIPDFTNWKDHDSYQQAFKRLLRDLHEEER